MKYLVLFNEIFNGRRAIGKKAQTVTIMLAFNNYHLNSYIQRLWNWIYDFEKWFEIEKYLTIYKTQDSQFIISSRYIAIKSTTTTNYVPLKNTSNINLSTSFSKQSHSYTKLRLVYNI